MSWQAVADVINHSPSYGSDRLVEIAIAERANEVGGNSKGSMADIARRANLCRFREVDKADDDYLKKYEAATRAARRSVRSLEGMGRVEGGEKTTRGVVVYRIVMEKTPDTVSGASSAPDMVSGVEGGVPTPDTMSGTPDHMSGSPRTQCPVTPDTVSPKPPFNPNPESQNEALAAAAAASPGGEDSVDQAVGRIFSMWKDEVFPGKVKQLTPSRRQVIVDRLGEGYSPEDMEQGIRNRDLSDWFSGRKARDGKQRFDLTDLLADGETLEEVRDASLVEPSPSSPGMANAYRLAEGAGRLTNPALHAIVDRGVGEGENDFSEYDHGTVEVAAAPVSRPAGPSKPPAHEAAEALEDAREVLRERAKAFDEAEIGTPEKLELHQLKTEQEAIVARLEGRSPRVAA